MRKFIMILFLLMATNANAQYKNVFNPMSGKWDFVGVSAVGDLVSGLCTANQILKKNVGNTAWACSADNASGGSAGTAPADVDYLVVTANGTLSAEVVIGKVDDTVIVANGTTWQAKAVADCDDSSGNHLNYDTGANSFSCGTSSSASGGDVISAGDCADGACGDGSSDGGTYYRLYDGDSNYAQLDTVNLSGDRTLNLPNVTGTLLAREQIDTSAEIELIVTNETGSAGSLVFSNGPTLSSPTISDIRTVDGGTIRDNNVNEQIIFSTTASAVNEFTVKNAATGNAPQLQATGGDTDVSIALVPKGAGRVTISTDLTITGDDLFMTTNTDRFVLMADGTNYNPEAINLGTDTVGDFVNSITAGNGVSSTGAASGENISHTLAVVLKTVGENAVGTTNSVSGLEFESAELTMLQGCGDGQILKWEETDDKWHCTADDSAGSITGTDMHVMFFDGADSPAGDAGMTYNKTTNVLTLTGSVVVADEVYNATDWNGETDVPTKNAVRDKIETISATEVNNLETITTGIATTEIPIGTAANTVVYAALSGQATMTNGGVVTVNDVTCTNCLTVTEVASADLATNVSDADFGDITVASGVWAVDPNAVVLETDTSGAYVANLTATAEETTVSGGGAENATITIGLPDNVEIDGTLHIVGAVTTNSTVAVNTAGVKLTGSNGALTFLGLGTGADESLTLDVNGTTNMAVFLTTTGVTNAVFEKINLSVIANEATDATLVLEADDSDDTNDTWTIESEAADNDLSIVVGATEQVKLPAAGGVVITGDGTQSTITEGVVVNNGNGTDEDDDFTVKASGGTYEIDAGGGTLMSTTNDAGWTAVDQTDNQACTTGCTSACLFGVANATGTAVTGIVSCADTTADTCVCMGPS